MKKLGFGLMRLPLQHPDDYASVDLDILKKMVDAYLEKGFCYFDTAYMYHNHTSETSIRETLVKRYPRERFILVDKMPVAMLKNEGDQERIFHEQMERCGVDYFDIYLIHNLGVENYKTAQDLHTFEFVQKKKNEGKARRIGFSYHDNAELLDEILTAHPEMEFVQLQINYLDWDNRAIQSGACYEVARKHGKQIVVMEPVKGGTLAHVPKAAKELFHRIHPDMSVASWAIRFTASLEGVTMVLSGMSDMAQLKDNISYMENFVPLTEEEKHVIGEATRIIGEAIAIPCTGCQYCVDSCPKNIAIPKYFDLYNNLKQSAPVPFHIQQVYYDNYTETHGKASDCIECGECERHCPQQLEVAQFLKDVAASFEKSMEMQETTE